MPAAAARHDGRTATHDDTPLFDTALPPLRGSPHHVISAGMGGPAARPELAVAASEAGGFGLRDTVGDLEKMALFAGESSAPVERCAPAAEVIDRLMSDAVDAAARIRAAGVH